MEEYKNKILGIITFLFIVTGCNSNKMKEFIPQDIDLKTENYVLIIQNNNAYNLIDDTDLLIANRNLIGTKFDFGIFIPAEGKPKHSLMLYKEKEVVLTKTVTDKNKLFIGKLNEHLIPLKEQRFSGTKIEVESILKPLTNKSIYYLHKPQFNKFDHSFTIMLPTIMSKAKYPLDKNGKEPYINGNYEIHNQRKLLQKQIETIVKNKFPKGDFTFQRVGGFEQRGTRLLTSDKQAVKNKDGNKLTDDKSFYYFNYFIVINCTPIVRAK